MSENERRSISLKIALFLDDQLAQLSSLGHQFEMRWYSISSNWDLETIGESFSRRGSQISAILGRLLFLFFPFWLVLHGLIRTFRLGWNWLVKRSVFSPAISLVAVAAGQLTATLSSFLIEFLRSRRPLPSPLTALTAVLMFSAAILGFMIFTSNNAELSKTYRQAIQLEIDRGNMDRVQLYQAKLAQLGIPFGHPEMQVVNQLLEQGKKEEAFRLAARLAPSHRPGLPAAHLFLALACLRGESGLASPTANELAARHLEHLKNISGKLSENKAALPPELQYLEGLLKLQQNQTIAAIETFENLSTQYWPAAVTSLEINSKLGRELESRAAGQELLRWSRLKPSILSELPPACYSVWYRTEGLVKAGPHCSATSQARRFIAEQWLRQHPTDSQAAEACLIEFGNTIETLAHNGQTEKRRAASMLISLAGMLGIERRDRLANWLIPRMSKPHNSTELEAILKLAQQSRPPAVLLEIMGTAAIANGEQDVALALLSRAVELDPGYGVAWNNLAVVAKRARALELAFDAARQAVRLEPNNDAMRLTRGMIAIEIKNWKTAQVDLEWVLQNQPDNIEIHNYLAMAYEQLEKPDKAAFHQLLAGK